MADIGAESRLNDVLATSYPEVWAGGFTRCDGTVEFYTRVNALCGERSVVLDLGAGRGSFLQDPIPVHRSIRTFKGRVGCVIGADPDPIVLTNPSLDEAVVLTNVDRLPFADSSFDIVISDHTLEHVENPVSFCDEIQRILRPGGWFCARTPHRWGVTGLGANLVPNRWHVRVLSHLQPFRKDVDVFPTRYRLNTRSATKRHFEGWLNASYGYRPEPSYLAGNEAVLRLGRLINSALPAAVLMIFVQKPDSAES